jgi:hypothetical protein
LPQCVARDAQQEHQQPFCLVIECADGISDVLVADDTDTFTSLLNAIKMRGSMFHSLPSGGYAHHQHSFMLKDSWTLCWAVIEEQFLTLWKNKSEFDASARSSSMGGMGGEVRPLLVMPLLCATVIQCTDNVTISIDLHQGGKVVSTHYLYLSTAAACSSWMTGFLKAIGYERGTDVAGASSLSTQSLTSLELKFPQPDELIKTPDPGCLALERGDLMQPKAPKVLPHIVYGSAEQLAATEVDPLPEKATSAWAPLPASELSKLTAALGNPLQAIGSRISASLSWLKGHSGLDQTGDAAAGVAGASNEAQFPVAEPRLGSSAVAPESSVTSQRSGPTSQSLQSVQSLRHRQPAAMAETKAADAVESAARPLEPPPSSTNNAGGLLSSLPLPECLTPPLVAFFSFCPPSPKRNKKPHTCAMTTTHTLARTCLRLAAECRVGVLCAPRLTLLQGWAAVGRDETVAV